MSLLNLFADVLKKSHPGGALSIGEYKQALGRVGIPKKHWRVTLMELETARLAKLRKNQVVELN